MFEVIDSGRGISPELQRKLFGRFVRDEKTSKEIQGIRLRLKLPPTLKLWRTG